MKSCFIGKGELKAIGSQAIILARAVLLPEKLPKHDCSFDFWHDVELIMLADGSLRIRSFCGVKEEHPTAITYWSFEPGDQRIFDIPKALEEAEATLSGANKRVEKLKELSRPVTA